MLFPTSPLITFNLLFTLTLALNLANATPIKPDNLNKLTVRKAPALRAGEQTHEMLKRHSDAAYAKVARAKGVPDHEIRKRLWIPPTHAIGGEDAELNDLAVEDSLGPVENSTAILGSDLVADTESDLDSITSTGSQATATSSSASSITVASAGPAHATVTVKATGSNKDGGFVVDDFYGSVSPKQFNSTSEVVQGGLPFDLAGHDTMYYATVDIGTPPKPFRLIMDTGSADTWVYDETCDVAICGRHAHLGPNTSSSFVATPQNFSITYGSGSAAGSVVKDTLTIANMTLTDKLLGLVDKPSSDFITSPNDGLMGLSFSGASNMGQTPPVEKLFSAGLVKDPVMGYALGRIADQENIGEITFGQTDTSKYDTSTTETLRVTQSDGDFFFWQVDAGIVTVNGKDIPSPSTAILDTGTTFIISNPKVVAAFHKQIKGARLIPEFGPGTYAVPCTADQVVTMTFGKTAFQIDARDLINLPLTNDTKGECVSSITSSDNEMFSDTWLLGDVFLKNVYMATNSRDKTISLSARTDGRGSSTVSVADTLAANASATGTGQAHSGASALTSTSWLAMGLLMTTITAACML